MAYGDDNDFGWCNLLIKFALFVMNMILLVSTVLVRVLDLYSCFDIVIWVYPTGCGHIRSN